MSVFIDALKDKGIKYEPAEVPTLEEAQSKKIGFGTFLEESPTLQTTAEKPIDEIGEYSAKDLTEDRFYDTIKDYMELRFNFNDEEYEDRDNIVRMYLNNMRGFSGGNSLDAIGEISFLNGFNPENSVDADKLSRVGKAYTLFEGMETLFGSTSLSEKGDILFDYTRKAILDPVNLIGFGLGKAFTLGGTKITARIAQQKAMDLYKRRLAKELQKGVTMDVAKKSAEKSANNLWTRTMIQAAKESKDIAVKDRIKKNANNGLKAYGTNKAWTEIGTNTSVDVIAGIGTAIAYENGVSRTTGRDAEYFYASGMAALGSMVVGGSQGLLAVRAANSSKGIDLKIVDGEVKSSKGTTLGTEDLLLPDIDVATPIKLEGLDRIVKSLRQNIAESGGKNSWRKKVDAGKDLSQGRYFRTFFREMLYGNDEKGLVGLSQIMYEEGMTYVPRFKGDKFTNFAADTIKKQDPQDVKKFLKEFEEITGITMYTMPDSGISKKLSDFTPKDFANALANWASEAGKDLGTASAARRVHGISDISEDSNLRTYAMAVFDEGIASKNAEGPNSIFRQADTEVGKKVRGISDFLTKSLSTEGIRNIQNRIIRLLVSAPSTSYLNLIGWGAASGINSLTDIGLGLAYMGRGIFQKAIKNPNASESFRISGAYLRANRQKVRNLLDPNMTNEAFQSIVRQNPDSLRELVKVLPGGVESIDKLIKEAGFDPNITALGMKADEFTDFIQKIGFVKLQDVFTKSQEFTYQLDKNLRISFNKGWGEFFADPDAAKLMNTKEYIRAVARASYESQRAIFSKSFKAKGTVGELAGFIEEARNIPGVGLLVPFGRFFNNTVAFSSDMSGISFFMRMINKQSQTREAPELAMRAAIGYGLMFTMAEDEKIYREWGLNWDQRRDKDTGAVITEKYNFPVSHFKAAARIWSYWLDGESPPKGEVGQIIDVVGLNQLTRQLDQVSNGLGRMFEEGISGEVSVLNQIAKGSSAIGAQVVSGSTRFLDPYNSIIGLARGKDYRVIDRKQGIKSLNNALRYMDQFIGAAIGDLQAEKQDAALGDIRSDATKNLGRREVELTDTAKVMNIVGKPNFLANEKTEFAMAGNRFNEMFHLIVENRASDLLKTKAFREGDFMELSDGSLSRFQIRKKMVENLLKDAKQTTKVFMRAGIEEFNDIEFAKFIDLENKYTFKVLDKAVREISGTRDIPKGKKIKDLNLQELKSLEAYLEYKDKVLKIYGQ